MTILFKCDKVIRSMKNKIVKKNQEILGDFGLEITDTTETRFHCDCSKERVSRALSTLSKKDLDSIIADGESIEVKCQFCNKAYEFTVDELKEMR